MKTVEETRNRLVLEDKPWILGGLLIVGILFFLALALGLRSASVWLTLGFGLAAVLISCLFVVFVQRVVVIFDRYAGTVVIRRRSLNGETEQSLPLVIVTGADVETSRSISSAGSGGRSTSITHRPVLVTRSGPVPLTQIYSSGQGAERIAAVINRWLASAPH